jgi:hypothetical protein
MARTARALRRPSAASLATRATAAAMLAILSALAACTSAPHAPAMTPPPPPPAPSPPPPPADPSYDWRRLPLAPLGTPFKSLNPGIHEVLLFRDSSPQPDPDADEDSERAETRDCYAPNDGAPRFVGRPTEAYLLCFHDDRLSRAQAQVRFDAADAEPTKLFATLCTDWLVGSEPELQAATHCAGHDGSRAFAARLTPGGDSEAATLRIVVYDVSQP